jgi:multiple sugar transport system substrate-binding protein
MAMKKMAITLTTLTMACSLAACGGGNSAAPAQTPGQTPAKDDKSPQPTGNSSGNKQEQVEITFARGKDVTGATDQLVKDFEAKHPNIKVKFREMPADSGQSHDQYVTMFNASSSDVDVFDIDVIWPAEFAQAGYLEPLDNYLKADGVNLKDYIPGAVDAASFNGKQWAMPRFIDTGLLFSRKDIVDKPPATWEELIAAAKADKGKNGTKYGYLMQAKQYEGLVCNAIEFIGAYGGKVVDDKGNITINSPQTVKGLEVMKQVVGSDFVPSNITTYTELESHTGFINGESVFIRNWPYQYALAQDKTQSKIVDKIGVAPLPKGDVRSAAALGGWMTAINKNSKHKKEAWEFLKYVTGAEGEKTSALIGGASPTLSALYNDNDLKSKNPIYADPGFVAGISAAVSRPVSPVYPKLSDIMQTEISKFLAGQQSAQDAVKNMDDKMKAVVK